MPAPPSMRRSAEIVADGVEDLTVISLAPYRCEVSTDAYEAAVEKALSTGKALGSASSPTGTWRPGYVQALGRHAGEGARTGPCRTPL